MSITDPEPTRLTLMDQAVITYHQMGENFLDLLDHYLSSFPEEEKHIRTGPNFFLMFRKSFDDGGDFWLVDYFGGTMAKTPLMLSFMPYYLDRVAFLRYAKYRDTELRFFKTDKLLKYYGLKTIKTASTAAASTAAASPDSDCE